MTSEKKDQVAGAIGLSCAMIVGIILILKRVYFGGSYEGFEYYGRIGGFTIVGVGVVARITLAFYFNDKSGSKESS